MTCPTDVSPADASPADVLVDITRLGQLGDGVGAWQGGALHIPGALPGERVRVRPEPGGGQSPARAVLQEILTPAPDRVAPCCPHAGQCGGCVLQHLSLSALGAWKQARVQQALVRAGFAAAPLPALVQVPPASRRRATFAARREGGRVVVGYCQRRSHRLVALQACPVLLPALAALPPVLARGLAPVLAAGTGAGETLDISVTLLEGGLDLVFTGPARLDLRAREALAALAEALDVARLTWRPTLRAVAEPVAVRRTPHVMLGGVPVTPPPGGFLQAAARAEAALVQAVLAALPAGSRVADLFCGCGTFSFPLAAAGHRVLAVDADSGAMTALAAAARSHSGGAAPPITPETRDLMTRPLLAASLKGLDAVVFDPPRAGAAAQAAALASAGVPVVVAVSCNPATLERDARPLAQAGYHLGSALAVDQFLWSAHVELVAVFVRGR